MQVPADSLSALTPDVQDTSTLVPRRGLRRLSGITCAFTVIMLLAAWLRLGDVAQVGIRFDDEAAYASDARLWHRCAKLLIHPSTWTAAWHGDNRAIQTRMSDLGIDFGSRYIKPSQGYTFLGAAAMFAFGDGPHALVILNAFIGTLTVLVLYGVTTTLLNPKTALCAALFLAISPYHLAYCRSAWPTGAVILFSLLGIWCWSLGRTGRWTRTRASLLAGLSIGYACTCHYSALYIAFVLMASDVLLVLFTRSNDQESRCWKTAVSRWGWMLLGGLAPALIIEAVFQAARMTARITDSYLPVITYFEGWVEWTKIVIACGVGVPESGPIHWGIPLGYASYFIHWHGVAALVVMLVGMVAIARSKGAVVAMAVAPILVIGLLSFQRFTIARACVSALPMACVCMAVGFSVLLHPFRTRKWIRQPVGLILMACLLYVPATQALSLRSKKSDLQAACQWVAQRGPATMVAPLGSCERSKYSLYLERTEVNVRRENFHHLGTPSEVLDRLRQEGVRWMLTDQQIWHYRDPDRFPGEETFHWWRDMDDHLKSTAVLVAEFPHTSDYRWEFLAEGPGVGFVEEMERIGDGPIRIYDLQARPSESINSLARSDTH